MATVNIEDGRAILRTDYGEHIITPTEVLIGSLSIGLTVAHMSQGVDHGPVSVVLPSWDKDLSVDLRESKEGPLSFINPHVGLPTNIHHGSYQPSSAAGVQQWILRRALFKPPWNQ